MKERKKIKKRIELINDTYNKRSHFEDLTER